MTGRSYHEMAARRSSSGAKVGACGPKFLLFTDFSEQGPKPNAILQKDGTIIPLANHRHIAMTASNWRENAPNPFPGNPRDVRKNTAESSGVKHLQSNDNPEVFDILRRPEQLRAENPSPRQIQGQVRPPAQFRANAAARIDSKEVQHAQKLYGQYGQPQPMIHPGELRIYRWMENCMREKAPGYPGHIRENV